MPTLMLLGSAAVVAPEPRATQNSAIARKLHSFFIFASLNKTRGFDQSLRGAFVRKYLAACTRSAKHRANLQRSPLAPHPLPLDGHGAVGCPTPQLDPKRAPESPPLTGEGNRP